MTDIDLNETYYSTPDIEAEEVTDHFLTLDYHPVKPGSVNLVIVDPHRSFYVEDDGEGNLWEMTAKQLDGEPGPPRGPKFGVVYYETGYVHRLKAIASYTYDPREDE